VRGRQVQKGTTGQSAVADMAAPDARRTQNMIAPVLGGGRFTQPGADGGERLTHHKDDTRHRNGAADNSGAAASPY